MSINQPQNSESIRPKNNLLLLRSAGRLLLTALISFTLLRVVFYFLFREPAVEVSRSDLVKSFTLGLRFDLRIGVFLILPLLLFATQPRWSWVEKSARKFWLSFYTFLLTATLAFYAMDFGYYAYLRSRVNFRIFEFLKNPILSLQMVQETYNLLFWTPLFLVLGYVIFWFLKKWIFPETPQLRAIDLRTFSRRQKIALGLSVFVVATLAIHNSFGQYPLRWSDAFFSQNNFLSHLAMNPLHYVFDTAKNSKKDYDTEKVRAAYDRMAQYLMVESPDTKALNFKRPVIATPQIRGHRPANIVYIVMESFAAYKSGVFGGGPDSSPHFDELAKKSWLFRNFYVPTEGTARSMFCTLTGIPDINAKSTSSRNPLIINQHSLINTLKDYQKYYFIGGNATWGNIRGVYMNNLDGLEMFEEDRLNGPKTDVWGLSDLDLFRESARILNERAKAQPHKPFVAVIQSASFHRPYTIPPEHGSFQTKELTKDELAKIGFDSNAQYNSFRFSDYALGEFFHLIQQNDFFNNTIFVIHGDHGLPHDGAPYLSAGYKFFNINRFHVPLVIFSPLLQSPKVFDDIITQPDVWPTLLGLFNRTPEYSSLGVNFFSPNKGKRYAFSYVYYSDPLELFLYDNEYLVKGTENGIQSLHKYNGSDPQKDVKDEFPEKYKEMSELLSDIFETSKYLIHHNPK